MNLSYISKENFDSLLSTELNPLQKNKIFSDLCRINILYMICSAGSGHIGSSFSSVDAMSWIMGEIKSKEENVYFFSSKGHDAPAMYCVMISLGQLDFSLLNKLRKIDGLPGHPDINTPNIFTNTGSLGMGISKAKGIIKSNRLKNKKCKVFVMTGDGELQEGQVWESLNRLSQEKMEELIILVDNNKFQSDRRVSTTSDLKNLENKFKSFGVSAITCDGNNVEELSKALDKISEDNEPSAIILDTVKGSGVSFMEGTNLGDQEFYKFHSGAVDQKVYDKSIAELTDKLYKYIDSNKINYSFNLSNKESKNNKKTTTSSQNLINAYSKALINQASLNKKIVALDGDLILDTGLIEFEKKFPNRFFECGIAEQDMVSQAGSFAKEGFIPFVHSFSSFLTSRPNEQIYNNSTEKTKVIYVGSLAGLLPGGPGHSHQAVRDIASMSGIPNLEMIQPLNEIETKLAVEYAVNSSNNIYIRLCSLPINLPFNYPKKDSIKIGEGTVISDGEEIVIFCYSPLIFTELWKAKEQLVNNNINPKLISFPWLNKFSSNWIKNQIEDFKHVITIDDHYIEGGFGEKFISNAIKNIDASHIKVTNIGIDEIPHSGTNEEVIDYHGLSASKLKQKIINLIKS